MNSGWENGEPNLTQQPARECMVEDPIKEALEFMNNVVKNVQEELIEVNINEERRGWSI